MLSRCRLGVSPLARPTERLSGPAWIAATWIVVLSVTGAPAQEPYRPLETGGLSAETAALLMSGQEGGPIPLHAIAVPTLASEGTKAPIEVFVEAEGKALLAGHEEEQLRLELCLYALVGSRVADSRLETVELLLARDRESLLSAGVKLRSTLELAAGDYRLRVLVRNVQTGSVGLRSLAVSVPAVNDETEVLPLLVRDAPDGWLRLARSREPSVVGFWPSARPVLEPDRDTDLEVFVHGLEPTSAGLEIRGAGGRQIELPAAVSPADGSTPPGLRRWSVRFHIPSLEPGTYALRLRVTDAKTSPELPIVVDRSGGASWARPAAAPAAALTSGRVASADERRSSRRAATALTAKLERDYHRSLAHLAAADTLRAVTELRSLELEAAEQPGGLEAMAEAEARIAAVLAKTEAGSLTPLFDLHYRAYLRYLSEGRFQLSSHSRQRLFALVDLYLAQKPEDSSAAVDILVAMAGQLQRSQMARFSSVVFHRVLEIDPQNEGALLGLAAGLEKRGAYSEAVGFLEQLATVDPENREARLRLAVNLARSGSRGKARRLLKRLVDSPQADWILAVAYHELVRDLLARDRLEEARTLLESAGERLPADDQLQLLFSVVAEAQRGGEPNGATGLVLRSRTDEPSARHRYQMWPRLASTADEPPTSRSSEALAAALEGLRGEA
jgi:tetratricopeptide (TPR) repeat protein